jgi:hypothetical protein
VLAQLAFGMMGYEFAQGALATRVAMENLFMVVVVGDMIGIPVMPPYYSLSLLPYVVPEIPPFPDPFHGQFIQMDVLSVTPTP